MKVQPWLHQVRNVTLVQEALIEKSEAPRVAAFTGPFREYQIRRRPMVDEIKVTPDEDEVILCVRYTTPFGWVVALILLGAVIGFVYALPLLIVRGYYIRLIIASIGAMVLFMCVLDFFFTKQILFYRNRLTKVWYFFGKRTIPYERAKLFVVSRSVRSIMVWVPKSFVIREMDESGKAFPVQVYISFCSGCVSKETRTMAELAMSYLLGLEDSSTLYDDSRILARSILPKEVLCQE